MAKIQGIKSVDFKITAEGEGVVNWNGTYSYYDKNLGKTIENHLMPKLRNLNIFENGSPKSSTFKNAQLYVSQNCIRHYIFKNESFNLKSVSSLNVEQVLCSILGLVRGYMITDNGLSIKRKSCLLLEDFVDENAVLIYEVFSNSKTDAGSSYYTKTNVGKTNYIAYGSISVEDLQFIVLEDTFKRSAYKTSITISDGEELVKKLNNYFSQMNLDKNKNPFAIFKTNYIRKGSLMSEGEAGILLNDDAIDFVIKEIIERFKDLFIKQSKGYLSVTSVLVDYNDGLAMRIKRDEGAINVNKEKNYAVYYEHKDISDDVFDNKMNNLSEKEKERKKSKIVEKKEKNKETL